MPINPFFDQTSRSAPWPSHVHRSPEIGETGLVLGLGTRLIRTTATKRLAFDSDRERLLALLSVVGRRPVSAAVLKQIKAASDDWHRGEKALAHLRLIFAGLPRLDDPVDAYRLSLAEYLLDEGMAPRTLMTELDLDPAALDLLKYDPDQPRVPAGHGYESGRWVDVAEGGQLASEPADATPAERRSDIILVADQTPGGFSYGDKIQRQMKSRNYSAEQIDEAVRAGQRIDALNKRTGGPATRYVNPNTGRSVVIDNTTNEVIQVDRPDFEFGPKGGDVPGAIMRPAPLVEEPIIVPDVILPL